MIRDTHSGTPPNLYHLRLHLTYYHSLAAYLFLMFHFKHPGSKKYLPIEAQSPDQFIKDAVDQTFKLLGMANIDWDHREVRQDNVNGSDPSTMTRDKIPIYFKCSTVVGKWLSTKHCKNKIVHITPVKKEPERADVPGVIVTASEDFKTPPVMDTLISSPPPIVKPEIREVRTPTPRTIGLPQLSYQHYHHHHQANSNNFQIDGSHNNAANTAGTGAIIGQDVTNNRMQSVEHSNNTMKSCTMAPLAQTSSTLTADGRHALKPSVEMTDDIDNAMDEHKEAYLRDLDTTLNASNFAEGLSQRMGSVLHLDNIAYVDTSSLGPNEDLDSLHDEDDIKSWKSLGVATAFIVGPRLLLTNWHVFPTISFARFDGARVVFDYNKNDSGRKEGRLNPDLFYWSDRSLDYCLIGFDYAVDDVTVRAPIIMSSEKLDSRLKRHNRLTIIQHPESKPKRLSVDGCVVKGQDVNKGFLLYSNDTAGGSSGSPVFTRTWILVALHHAAISLNQKSKKRARLSELTEKGQVLNQGTLISTIYQALLVRLKDMKLQGQADPSVKEQVVLLQQVLLQDPKANSKIKKEINAEL